MSVSICDPDGLRDYLLHLRFQFSSKCSFTQSNYFITSCSFHMPRGSVWICRLLKSPLIRCQKKKIEDVVGNVLLGRTRTSESFVIGNSFLPRVICTLSSLPQDIYLASPMMIPNSVKRILVPQRTSV